MRYRDANTAARATSTAGAALEAAEMSTLPPAFFQSRLPESSTEVTAPSVTEVAVMPASLATAVSMASVAVVSASCVSRIFAAAAVGTWIL